MTPLELYPEEAVRIAIERPVLALPGKFSFILQGGGREIAVMEASYSDLPVDREVKVKGVSPGKYEGSIVYTEPGYRTVLAEAPIEVITGRLHATVVMPEERPWVVEGPLEGKIILRSERPVPDVDLRLLAGPAISIKGLPGRTAVWEKALKDLPAGETAIPFAYTPRQRESPEAVELVVISAREGLKVTTEYGIARREFFV
ncbi:MAG: hypothetical protein H5T99_04565, partial [Moorella sp. (in: Bacteria)]|nr:hypothetical protein [Moorella sp. (in: firmicutes)]